MPPQVSIKRKNITEWLQAIVVGYENYIYCICGTENTNTKQIKNSNLK